MVNAEDMLLGDNCVDQSDTRADKKLIIDKSNSVIRRLFCRPKSICTKYEGVPSEY
jgi:hypothetical protein